MKKEKNTATPTPSDKKSIRNIINEYMETRREHTYARDEEFHKSIAPDHTHSDGESKRVILPGYTESPLTKP